MPAYCAPCNRSFNRHEHLEQHLKTSSRHKSPTQRLPLAIAPSPSTPQATIPAVQATTQGVKSPWSRITMAVLDELSAHCHSPKELKENGYIVHPYNPLDYVNEGICEQCHSKQTRIVSRECTFHPSKRNKWNKKKPYKCCYALAGNRGCQTSPTHNFQLPKRALTHMESQQTPAASAEPKFPAVALDCEMAGIAGGAGEVILLCATDFITGAVLVNRLVCPREKITQMRTSIHGITKSTLDEAISEGQALAGWEEARSELWKYIDDKTILVGHSLEHDLGSLRMIHPRVVDSGILTENAVGQRRRFGLQTLCSELLKVQIRKGKGGIHDCLEDALASREVVLFCIQARSQEAFRAWAEAKKRELIRLEKERKMAKEKKANKDRKKGTVRAGGGSSYYTKFGSDDEEVLHWSDIAEDLGWPHPDTGYDPWSD